MYIIMYMHSTACFAYSRTWTAHLVLVTASVVCNSAQRALGEDILTTPPGYIPMPLQWVSWHNNMSWQWNTISYTNITACQLISCLCIGQMQQLGERPLYGLVIDACVRVWTIIVPVQAPLEQYLVTTLLWPFADHAKKPIASQSLNS